MKYTFKNIRALFFGCCCLFCLHTNAQSWENLGSPGFSANPINSTSIAFNRSGTPYVAFNGQSDTGGVATVMKYDGDNWVLVGAPGFTHGATESVSLAIDTFGTPYIACMKPVFGKAFVMKFNGADWVSVGDSEISSGGTLAVSIAVDMAGTPYVAYVDFSGTTRATVLKFNGSSWVTVGSPGFTPATTEWVSLALDADGVPYVAYSDRSNSGKAAVMKFDGSSWVNVGPPGFSVDRSTLPAIAIGPGNTPFVAFGDYANHVKTTVMKYIGSSWINVGTAGFSNDTAWVNQVAVDNSGTPFVAYTDGISSPFSATQRLKKFNGSDWASVGDTIAAARTIYGFSMALSPGGVPHIAYSDTAASYKASVIKCTAPVGLTTCSERPSSLTIYPNPGHGAFTISQSGAAGDHARMIITNTLGEKINEFTTTANTGTTIKLDVTPGMYFISSVTSLTVQSATLIIW